MQPAGLDLRQCTITLTRRGGRPYETARAASNRGGKNVRLLSPPGASLTMV